MSRTCPGWREVFQIASPASRRPRRIWIIFYHHHVGDTGHDYGGAHRDGADGGDDDASLDDGIAVIDDSDDHNLEHDYVIKKI